MESIVLKGLKESQIMEDLGRLEEALNLIEEISSKFPDNVDLFCRGVHLCNKLKGPYFLFKAKSLLNDWVSKHRKTKSPLDDKVVFLYSLTLNNTALEHQAEKKYHKALNFLMRALKFLETHELEGLGYILSSAKTYLNLSSLYYELRKYNESISQAEQVLNVLQSELENSNKIKQDDKVFEIYHTYISALYNIGISEESSGNAVKAKVIFFKALQVNKRHISVADPLMVNIRKAIGEEIVENDTAQIPSISKRTHSEMFHERNYSSKQAKNLWKRMDSDAQIKGASQFFMERIQKKFQLNYIRSSVLEEQKEIDKEDQKLKRNILNLRLKKKPNLSKKQLLRGDYVKLRIENLKETDENRASVFDKQLRSSVKSFFREKKPLREDKIPRIVSPTPKKAINFNDKSKNLAKRERLDFHDANTKISESMHTKNISFLYP